MKNKTMNMMNIFAFALLALVLSSCEIDKGINSSPNAINEDKVKSKDGIYGLTISLQVAVSDFYSGDRSRIASIWAWQMCAPDGLGRPQPVAWNSYSMTKDGPTADMWKIAYRGVRIANDIINFTPEVEFNSDAAANTQQRNAIIGMAKAYKALFFGEMAAFYGSIPIEINGLESPKFATQQAAYAEVQALLDQALTNFANSSAYARDLNYGGNGTDWTRAIHSLKARYFLHAKNYASAASEAAMGIADNSTDLMGQHSDNPGEFAPWGHWCNTEVGEPIRGEATYVRLLKAEADDSRLSAYFSPNDGENYWGFAVRAASEEGADTNELNLAKIVSMKKYRNYSDGFPMISYNETMFIAAEAKARTGDNGGAASDLNTMRNMFGIGDYSGSDLIGEILKQKNLTLFLEGQTYTDMRRTGTLPSSNIPLRFIYPEDESNANSNTPADNPSLVDFLVK